MVQLTPLPERGVIAIEGDDRVAFLQGLVSNDIEAVRPGHAVWAAFLTAQGKWLADFFVFAHADALLLDCEAEQVPILVQRLSRYRLRMRVTLRPEPELHVHVAWAGDPGVGGIVAPDPRLPGLGWRILAAEPLPATATPEDWDRHRLAAGVPDGSKDMESDRSVLLEAGFDELAGVSWSKGCYMGQELTARTKYRGLVKRRLVPVTVEGPLPPAGTPVLRDGVEVGSMRSGRDGIGLASLRLDAIGATLHCGDATLMPSVPAWMRLPATTS
ncbi:folate-binding protein YgfZ [Acidisphaera sp. S103]|uniref:CAF17-like 4Fe-4S cluster assembly/insertion protein YgfZ n=1 Tax=Acidisphaera sp. S103 TaxID=1747223 RepID=UPI00131CCF40|nr:folate-binding protein [Acidisphaera sp. S103]